MAPGEATIPLCIDLDDTLISTDVLWESAVQLLRRPKLALRSAWALATRGKAGFKAVLAEAGLVDPAALPYRDQILDYARSQRALGREVVLATATHAIVAQGIADHLGIFTGVVATKEVNLSGAAKRDALVARFGSRGFDYVGDHAKDIPVFSVSRQALLVAPSPRLRERVAAAGNLAKVFAGDPVGFGSVARAMRLHQWVKNVLLAVPLLSAHRVLDLPAWSGVVAAFVAFGLVASATYILNDLLDLQADRTHAKKRLRPFASGALSIPVGLGLGTSAGAAGFVLAWLLLPPAFSVLLGTYAALTLAYSLDLKRRLLVDVLALAVLYTLRILAGGAAIGVAVSEWLLMFSLFLFLSLAFLKRAIELSGKQGDAKVSGRGYSPVDQDSVRTIGMSSGLASVMVLALYINSPAVMQYYRAPAVLWLLCPLLIYWISRIWFLAGRGEVHHDPVVFALVDWRSYVIAAFGLGVVAAATVGGFGVGA